MTGLFHDLRESFAGFFLQSLRVADQSAYDRTRQWKTSFPLVLAVVLALVVGYVTSSASMLWTEYSYASTLSTTPQAPINSYGIENVPSTYILSSATNYESGVKQESGGAMATNIGIGALIVGVTSVLRFTLSWWPLHPIGFIVLYSYAMQRIWLSLFLGWVGKVIVVRLGGASLLQSAKPVFIGLVVGEAFAAGVWLIVSLVLNLLGMEYRTINLLPG
jgi:hypothetical protein